MSPLRHNHIDVFQWYYPSNPEFVHLETPTKPFHLQAAWSSKTRSLLDIGFNDVPVTCITNFGFYSAARFRINDLEYNVNSWPEIGAISLPDACESSFVTFVYRCYSQTVYATRDNPLGRSFLPLCKANWLSRAGKLKRGRKLFCSGQYKVLAESLDFKRSMALEWSLVFGCSVAFLWSVMLEWSLAFGWSVDLGWYLALE